MSSVAFKKILGKDNLNTHKSQQLRKYLEINAGLVK